MEERPAPMRPEVNCRTRGLYAPHPPPIGAALAAVQRRACKAHQRWLEHRRRGWLGPAPAASTPP
eukprot:6557921-Alexandrium_andersonii.AAC.1